MPDEKGNETVKYVKRLQQQMPLKCILYTYNIKYALLSMYYFFGLETFQTVEQKNK